MLKFSNLREVLEAANQLKNSAVEAENHVKYAASSKSSNNRGIFLRTACFALLAMCITFSSCEDKDNIRVTDVEWDEHKTTIEVDETVTATGKVTPANHTESKFTVTSSDDDVATVDGTVRGANVTITVMGVSPGKATITIATSEGVELKSVEFTVVEKGSNNEKPIESIVSIGDNGNWFINGEDKIGRAHV